VSHAHLESECARLTSALSARDTLVSKHEAELGACRRTMACLRGELSSAREQMEQARREEQQRAAQLHTRFEHLMQRKVHHRASVDRQILDVIAVYDARCRALELQV
jgi:septal ring factor EnvC (AmiA/AmiB activator)